MINNKEQFLSESDNMTEGIRKYGKGKEKKKISK